MFGVRSLLVDKKALLMKKTWPCVVSTTDAIAAVASHTRTSLAMQNTYFFDKHRLSLHTTVLVQRHHDCPGRLSAVTCKQTGLRAPPPAMQSHDLIQAPSNPHMTATIGLWDQWILQHCRTADAETSKHEYPLEGFKTIKWGRILQNKKAIFRHLRMTVAAAADAAVLAHVLVVVEVVIICPIAIAYSMGQIIKSVCVCLSVCQSVCLCICPSASTLTVAFLDRFSPKLAQT